MREIKHLVIHSTETPPNTTVESMQTYWRSLGWKKDGYHFVVDYYGKIIKLEPISSIANGVAGHNSDSIHIAYIGGLGQKDTRSLNQVTAIRALLYGLKACFPNAEILGHKDFAGVAKICPFFDAKQEYSQI